MENCFAREPLRGGMTKSLKYLVCVTMHDKMEEKMKEKAKLFTTKNMALIAVFGALAGVLMMLKIPVPFAPDFYKIDISDLPVLLGGFMIGPLGGVCIAFIKILLNILMEGGSKTYFVGEFANFLAAICLMLPATWIYNRNKSRKMAVLGLTASGIFTAIVMVFVNGYVLLPIYDRVGWPIQEVINMGSVVNPLVSSKWTLLLFSVLPFNLLKCTIVSVITIILYKRLKHVLFTNPV